MSTPAPRLSPAEHRALWNCENVIEKAQQTFLDVATALAIIRDGRLYRETHSTFEDYCREKWGWGRAYCYQIIGGADAVKSLPPEMSTMVDNQRQARELAKVDPENRVEVLQAVSEAGPVTAKAIRQAAQTISAPESTTTPTEERTAGDENGVSSCANLNVGNHPDPAAHSEPDREFDLLVRTSFAKWIGCWKNSDRARVLALVKEMV